MARTVKPSAARNHRTGDNPPQPGQLAAEDVHSEHDHAETPMRNELSKPGEPVQPYVSLKQRVLLKLRRLTASAEGGHDRTQTPTMQPHRLSFAAEEIAKQRRLG